MGMIFYCLVLLLATVEAKNYCEGREPTMTTYYDENCTKYAGGLGNVNVVACKNNERKNKFYKYDCSSKGVSFNYYTDDKCQVEYKEEDYYTFRAWNVCYKMKDNHYFRLTITK